MFSMVQFSMTPHQMPVPKRYMLVRGRRSLHCMRMWLPKMVRMWLSKVLLRMLQPTHRYRAHWQMRMLCNLERACR